MRILTGSLALLLCLGLRAQHPLAPWIGIWKGELEIHNPGQNVPSMVPMELHIAPTDSNGQWNWTLVYGSGEKTDIRNYLLQQEDAAKGWYMLDEHNGIRIRQVLAGNVFLSAFEVSGTRLSTIALRDGDRIIWEISTYRNESCIESGGLSEEIPPVKSWTPGQYQRALLTRVP